MKLYWYFTFITHILIFNKNILFTYLLIYLLASDFAVLKIDYRRVSISYHWLNQLVAFLLHRCVQILSQLSENPNSKQLKLHCL